MSDSLEAVHRPLYISHAGTPQPDRTWDPRQPSALLPGAFNPVHQGHWELARIAATILEMPVSFELSIANVDKATLRETEIRQRLAQFAGQAPVWLTQAPRFVDKARLFPGAVFVVGADTAERLVACRYYEGDPGQMLAALSDIDSRGCRFLVACRVDGAGYCRSLDEIEVPVSVRHLFTAVAADRFRLDVSSTLLRARGQER